MTAGCPEVSDALFTSGNVKQQQVHKFKTFTCFPTRKAGRLVGLLYLKHPWTFWTC